MSLKNHAHSRCAGIQPFAALSRHSWRRILSTEKNQRGNLEPTIITRTSQVARILQSTASDHSILEWKAKNLWKAKQPHSSRIIAHAQVSTLSTADVRTTEVPVVRPGTKDVQFLSFDNGYFTVLGSLELAAPASLLYEILSDYDSCARIFHNISDSKTQKRPDGRLDVVQTCRWAFLTFSGTFECNMVVDQDEKERMLQFQLQESSFMRDFKGSWKIMPAALNISGDSSLAHTDPDMRGCVVRHVLSVKPLMDMPAPLANITKGIFEQQVSSILDDLSAEVQRQMKS